jgi:hypothetical protein
VGSSDFRQAVSTTQRYSASVKQIWTGRAAQIAGKYGENAPTAAVCCNACRTCLTTNLLALATAGIAAAGLSLSRLAQRLAKPSF